MKSDVSKNGRFQSGQKYGFFHAAAGPAKRNIYPALGRAASEDCKKYDEALLMVIRKFDGELTDVSLPDMRAVDCL
ncbi:MAG: hypothetical protein LBT84_06235 [Spirochaetia bacterium]|jgi:hypothetical protein|nr:hypothetical protein [Spirochaetia bacterium]